MSQAGSRRPSLVSSPVHRKKKKGGRHKPMVSKPVIVSSKQGTIFERGSRKTTRAKKGGGHKSIGQSSPSWQHPALANTYLHAHTFCKAFSMFVLGTPSARARLITLKSVTFVCGSTDPPSATRHRSVGVTSSVADKRRYGLTACCNHDILLTHVLI